MLRIRERWLVVQFHLLALLLVALHLFVWRLPPTATIIPEVGSAEHQWWGLWPVTYVPAWSLGLGVGIILLSLIGVWLTELGYSPPFITKVASLQLPPSVVTLLFIGIFVCLFFTFPIVHTRWGDAYILTKAIALADPALRLTHSWQAPLDLLLHSQLWLSLHELMGWEDAMPVYRLLSPIAGLLYLWAISRVARQLTATPVWLTIALLASIGVMQLFFGYVENYSFAAAGILIYLWLGLSTLQGQRPLWQSALALALTNAFHPSTIVYAPSLLYIGWSRLRHTNAPLTFAQSLLQIALPMVTVAGITIVIMELGSHGIVTLLTTDRPGGGDARWLVPLWATTTRWEHYTLFSWPHLRDLLNQQLLVAPIILPMLLISLLCAREPWYHPFEQDDERILGRATRRRICDLRFTVYERFLALATLCHLGLILFWNPDYGGQRDWDLFSLAAIPMTLWLAYRLPRLFMCRRTLLAATIPLLMLQYLHLAAWIYQNTLPWEWP